MTLLDQNSEQRAAPQRCPAIRRDGQPCRGYATTSTGFCIGHTPESRGWRSRGGVGTRTSERADKRLPTRLRDIADLLHRAIYEAYDGSMPPQRAGAVAALARALIACVQAGEMELAVRALEQQVEQVSRTAPRRGRTGARYHAPHPPAAATFHQETAADSAVNLWQVWRDVQQTEQQQQRQTGQQYNWRQDGGGEGAGGGEASWPT